MANKVETHSTKRYDRTAMKSYSSRKKSRLTGHLFRGKFNASCKEYREKNETGHCSETVKIGKTC